MPKYDDLLPEPKKQSDYKSSDNNTKKKSKRRKSPSIIDLLVPAPMFDPNDVEQNKNLKLKIKKDEKGKIITPTADQL